MPNCAWALPGCHFVVSCFVDSESSTTQSITSCSGNVASPLLSYWRVECFLHPFTILALTLTINRGCDKSTTSAFAQFLWWWCHKVVPIKFGFGYCCWLDVATSFGTVFLALMHVAIALVDFFFEPLVSNSFADKYRRNAPCPDLIVPFPMERRGQSAKTHLLSLLCGN